MKRLLNCLLIISSLFGYLDWAKDQKHFVYELELEIISKLFSNPKSVLHPFTLIPFIGQILLLITIFQKEPNKKLTYLAIACLGLLMLMFLLVGILSKNMKIIVCSMQFILLSILTILYNRRKNIATI